ncbi:DNA cytosine methyltransferase [Paracoccus sp. XHP0099]|uniref:DNA (cytosine-5-)-methyltransferase n=1 Tax=Paracoccus marinaquae TaxID=2841926 RepID=A0ABS6ANG7_9RHOB|nr:DNA cytosine methyltransferase [Paracoccus marinaquae]
MVSRPRYGLSLCAGGGGLDMGLMLVEPGYHTRAFVEWEDWPRSVLIAAQAARYFAPAPIWDDLRSFDARPFRGVFDIVLAGYPCQPFSAAGKRGGASDPRHLWPEVARVIAECRPEWVFLENVAGHVTLGLESVLRKVWRLGYTPAAGLFSAAEVSAPHQRLRIFILAHTDEPASRHRNLQPGGQQRLHPQGGSAGAGHRQLVDAEGQRWREGRAGSELWLGRNAAPARAGGAMADPGRTELEGQLRGQHHPDGWQEPDGYPALPGRTGLHPPGPGDHAAWATILAARPDLAPALGFHDCLAWARRISADPEGPGAAAAEPALRRMADGLAHRARALRLLGNGVHPLAAAHAWRALAAAHGLGSVDLAPGGSGPAPGADVAV